ncbi:MAG: hypothetical protein A2284_14230 [Deltaproteobacteria bacterium RIFOXYA12_FULL_61_11]|nr:MAG: hypothetical protein A2284_14230 [Deltaproteobacteria bacterium RIFOXYA12_FULL_61_11]
MSGNEDDRGEPEGTAGPSEGGDNRVRRLATQLETMYHEYAFTFLEEYELYQQKVQVFGYDRKKLYANVRRGGRGMILCFNYNPGDLIWNIADRSKRGVGEVMRYSNRTAPQKVQSSPNLFHSRSFTTSERNLFVSEHDDTFLRHESRKQPVSAPPRDPGRPERTGDATAAKASDQPPEVPGTSISSPREAQGTRQEARRRTREAEPCPVEKPADAAPEPALRQNPPATPLERLRELAKKKGWLKE